MLPTEQDIKCSSSSLKWENKQTKNKETTGQLPILEYCKQFECLQTTSQFLFPCSKIKDISTKEEAGMPAGELRGKKWWSSNSVIILGSHPYYHFTWRPYHCAVYQKDQDCSICLWFGHGEGPACPSFTWIRKSSKESFEVKENKFIPKPQKWCWTVKANANFAPLCSIYFLYNQTPNPTLRIF